MDEKKKILIVDDWDDIRRILQGMTEAVLNKYFNRNDFVIDGAVNGKKALEYFNKNNGNVEMLLTDIRMPEMDGLTLLNKLHSNGYQLPKTIGIISGTVGDVLDSNIPNEYYHFVLEKPFRLEELRSLFNEHYFSKIK